jgi:uncharacterized protein
MPLLLSPVDGSPMKQINRFGIEIDVCPTSGGVWLDRGELDKLIAFIQNEDAYISQSAPHIQQAYKEHSYEEPSHKEQSYKEPHYKDQSYQKQPYKTGHKKESAMSKIMDIFDF